MMQNISNLVIEDVPICIDCLSEEDLIKLQDLTNQPNIDLRDDGTSASSSFIRYLQKALKKQSQPNHYVIRASLNNVVVGWSLLSVVKNTKSGWIDAGFYVLSTHRRLGIGTKLFEAAKNFAIRNDILEIFTIPWNSISRSFFITLKMNRVNSIDFSRPVLYQLKMRNNGISYDKNC